MTSTDETPERASAKPAKKTQKTTATKKRPGQRQGFTKDKPTDAEIEQRRHRVAVMLAARWPRFQMVERLGVSRATLERDIAFIRAEWRERAQSEIAEIVADELASLDELERRVKNDHLKIVPIDPKAVNAMLAIHDRRARLLGLDRPRKVEVSGANGQPLIPVRDDAALLEEIDRLTERLAAMPDRVGTQADPE